MAAVISVLVHHQPVAERGPVVPDGQRAQTAQLLQIEVTGIGIEAFAVDASEERLARILAGSQSGIHLIVISEPVTQRGGERRSQVFPVGRFLEEVIGIVGIPRLLLERDIHTCYQLLLIIFQQIVFPFPK